MRKLILILLTLLLAIYVKGIEIRVTKRVDHLFHLLPGQIVVLMVEIGTNAANSARIGFDGLRLQPLERPRSMSR